MISSAEQRKGKLCLETAAFSPASSQAQIALSEFSTLQMAEREREVILISIEGLFAYAREGTTGGSLLEVLTAC